VRLFATATKDPLPHAIPCHREFEGSVEAVHVIPLVLYTAEVELNPTVTKFVPPHAMPFHCTFAGIAFDAVHVIPLLEYAPTA
jgi:hypothetical protein